MGETRRKYTREFKIETVRLLEHSNKSARDIEADLGIGTGAIYRWKRELGEENLRAFPGNGNPRDEELFQLRKELAEARRSEISFEKRWPFS